MEKTTITLGHSPDADDAFMFYALSTGKIDTRQYEFRQLLKDIESLNQLALADEIDFTAVSVHAYAHIADRYVICPCGASVGDGYGPIVVAKHPRQREELHGSTIAVPGMLTTAFLVLRLWLGSEFEFVHVPFDQILQATRDGHWQGRNIDAGLVIHEGQLTYNREGLVCIEDLGRWWKQETGLPLPLGINVLSRRLSLATQKELTELLRESIRYALEHKDEALAYALQFGRGLSVQDGSHFVRMYVNDWTVDLGDEGRLAIETVLDRAWQANLIPQRIQPDFVAA